MKRYPYLGTVSSQAAAGGPRAFRRVEIWKVRLPSSTNSPGQRAAINWSRLTALPWFSISSSNKSKVLGGRATGSASESAGATRHRGSTRQTHISLWACLAFPKDLLTFRRLGWAMVSGFCVLLWAAISLLPGPHDGVLRYFLASDPDSVMQHLRNKRHPVVTEDDKRHAIAALPPVDGVSRLGNGMRTKIEALGPILKYHERNGVYDVVVYGPPQAYTALYSRVVILLTERVIDLLDTDELQATVAHEAAHEYFWNEYQQARKVHDLIRLKELELYCDGVAIITMNRLGLNPAKLMTGVEKIIEDNRKRLGVARDQERYPSIAERKKFAGRGDSMVGWKITKDVSLVSNVARNYGNAQRAKAMFCKVSPIRNRADAECLLEPTLQEPMRLFPASTIYRLSPLLAKALVLCVVSQGLDAQDASIPMKYEGGSLTFAPHAGLHVAVGNAITIKQGRQAYSIAPGAITEVSYGSDVHRRVGAAIGTALFSFGLGAMLLLVKTKKHYVGILWDGVDMQGARVRGGSVFKVGKGHYRGFIAALEGLTGMKAVNADSPGLGGTYVAR